MHRLITRCVRARVPFLGQILRLHEPGTPGLQASARTCEARRYSSISEHDHACPGIGKHCYYIQFRCFLANFKGCSAHVVELGELKH
jgi:hypothetical protein